MRVRSVVKVIIYLLFSFRGRISRKMWWVAMLVAIIFMCLVGFLLAFLVLPRIENAEIVVFLYLSALFLGNWMHSAINIKRLHDRNRTGWWQLLYFICLNVLNYSFSSWDRALYVQENPAIPLLFFVGFIYLAVQIAFLPGDKKKNRYGPPPQSLKEWWESYGQFQDSAIKGFTVKRIKATAHLFFSFRGRISRQMWWFAKCVCFVSFVVLSSLVSFWSFFSMFRSQIPRPDILLIAKIMLWLFILCWVWSNTVLNIKRFHDRNLSGWLALMGFIPVIGFIFNVVKIGCPPGDSGGNRYGDLSPQSLKEWWDG